MNLDTEGIESSLSERLPAPPERELEMRDDGIARRLSRYATAKARALDVSDYITDILPSAAPALVPRLRQCGFYLKFRDYYTAGSIRLIDGRFCRNHLLCPLCAIRRGCKLIGKYLSRYEELIASDANLRPYMVTFTVVNGPDLVERYKHLQRSLADYHKRRYGLRNDCEAKHAFAGAWSYEVKRGRNSGLWHPHCHAIWLSSSPPRSDFISDQWHRITGDSYIVDVRPIDFTDPVTGFMEVFKYAVKFSDQPLHDTVECYLTLRGRHLIGSFGGFRGLGEPKNLNDDPMIGLPYIDYVYRYAHDRYSLSASDERLRLPSDANHHQPTELIHD